MTQEAVAALYRAFRGYPLSVARIGCPCCWTDEEETQLRAPQLAALTPAALHNFQWSSMWTAGDDSDLRHFLPRILELALTPHGDSPEIEITLGLLTRGHWGSWPAAERKAIRNFLDVLWEVTFTDSFDTAQPAHVLAGLAGAQVDLAPFLERWIGIDSTFGRLSLAYLIANETNPSGRQMCNVYWPKDDLGSGAKVFDWLDTEDVTAYLFTALDEPIVEFALQLLPSNRL